MGGLGTTIVGALTAVENGQPEYSHALNLGPYHYFISFKRVQACMSASPVTYEDFQTANQAFVGNGGPWKVSFARPEDYAQCPLTKETWCDPGGYCLQCAVFPPDTASKYEITYTANISVNMAQYGSATALDFTWEFWPLYLGSNITAGSEFPIYSDVNGVGFQDTQIAQDFRQFFGTNSNGDRSWGSTPKVSHAGTTSVTSSGGARAYIPLNIKYSFSPGGHTENFNHYIKGIAFRITTPVQTVIPVTPSTTTATSVTTATRSSISSGSLTGTRPNDPSFPSDSSSSNSLAPAVSTSSPDSSSPQSKLSSAAVAGTVLGSIAFVFLIVALVFYHRRRSRQFGSIPLVAYKPPLSPSAAIYPPEKLPRSSVVDSTRSRSPFSPPFSVPAPISSPHATYSTHSGVHEGGGSTVISDTPSAPELPPPMYDMSAPYTAIHPRPIASASPALVAFATAHRDLISADLEGRLADAGYLPTDDPDNLSEEEWRMLHNVTKLELMRLRALYNSDGPNTDAHVKRSRNHHHHQG